MPCNSGQGREQETRCLCGICKPVQPSATPDRTLVMSRSAVRARSSALCISWFFRKNVLDSFAEVGLSGLDASAAMPLVDDHLDKCGDCCGKVEALLTALYAS